MVKRNVNRIEDLRLLIAAVETMVRVNGARLLDYIPPGREKKL
jgi:hypothetical protein